MSGDILKRNQHIPTILIYSHTNFYIALHVSPSTSGLSFPCSITKNCSFFCRSRHFSGGRELDEPPTPL